MSHGLDRLPEGATPRTVDAAPVAIGGRAALRITLTEQARSGAPGRDYVDMPTFLRIPAHFATGVIEVDLLSRVLPDAPEDARAFAGLAYRILGDVDSFEAVYLRPMNGTKLNPPPPRDRRAVQYFAFPDWKFDRIREEYPDGRYEAAAPIGPDEWVTLRLKVTESTVRAYVDGVERLNVEAKGTAEAGDIGLFVDIGTEAFFANLRTG